MKNYYFITIKNNFTPRELSLKIFKIIPFHNLSIKTIFKTIKLNFYLSLLFFINQNISTTLVNTQQNK